MNLRGLCNGDHLAVEFAVRDSEDDVDGVIDTQKAGVDHEVVGIAGSPDLVVYSGEGGATISLAWIGNGGVMIFLAGVIGGLIQGASPADMCRVMGNTCKSMWKAITTIVFIIAVAKVMGYSGMTSSIATLLAALTGSFFPALLPWSESSEPSLPVPRHPPASCLPRCRQKSRSRSEPTRSSWSRRTWQAVPSAS